MAIPRGTTPTHYFEVEIDLTNTEVLYLTYKQGSKIIVEKEKPDLTVTAEEVSVTLTQEETLAFSDKQDVEIQFRGRYPDGTAVESEILEVEVGRILKDGVI